MDVKALIERLRLIPLTDAKLAADALEETLAKLAAMEKYKAALLEVRHEALKAVEGTPLFDKWLGPCVGEPMEIPGLVREMGAELAEERRKREDAGRLLWAFAGRVNAAMCAGKLNGELALPREIREAVGWLRCANKGCEYDGPSYNSWMGGPDYCPDHAEGPKAAT